MTHPRKTIRATVVEMLKDASTSAGTRVYAQRSAPIHEGESSTLPAILVFGGDESAEVSEFGRGQPLDRTWNLTVSVVAKSTSDDTIDDTIDDLCEEVEDALEDLQALQESSDLENIFVDMVYNGCAIVRGGETNEYIDCANLTYVVRYRA